jgi:hypothetical protein
MISFIGLITFLLRLTLAIQGQVVAVLPIVFSEESDCVAQGGNDSHVHSITDFENGISSALCEGEKEEKSESESESLVDFLDTLNQTRFLVSHKEFYNPFFGNKALQGNQHLYDLLHSWKVHLS